LHARRILPSNWLFTTDATLDVVPVDEVAMDEAPELSNSIAPLALMRHSRPDERLGPVRAWVVAKLAETTAFWKSELTGLVLSEFARNVGVAAAQSIAGRVVLMKLVAHH